MGKDLKSSGTSQVGSSIAGGSSGTLLVLIAESLPDGSLWKPILLFTAPWFTVASQVIFSAIVKEAREILQVRKLQLLTKNARAEIGQILEDPNTSEPHREVLIEKLEKVNITLVDHHLAKIETQKSVSEKTIDLGKTK